LRNRQRTYYYEQLDRLFPGLREKFERAYGDRYSAASPHSQCLEQAFSELASKYRLERVVSPDAEQLTLF
jgi:hypothetical protein